MGATSSGSPFSDNPDGTLADIRVRAMGAMAVGPHPVAVEAHGGRSHQRHDAALGRRVVGLGDAAHVGARGEADEGSRLLLAHDRRRRSGTP